jgi:DOPA 4,5-dioxygenase
MTARSDAPFHAHVYFTADSRELAVALRDCLLATRAPAPTPGVRFVGELREFKVGPHPLAQFEVHFDESCLPDILPALQASGLTILVHPLTDDDRADHTSLARWIGEPLDLDLSVLDPPGMNQGFARYGVRDL